MSILSSSRLDIQSPSKAKVVRFQLDYNLKSLLLNFGTDKDENNYVELLRQIRNVGQEIRDDDLIQLLKEARGCISILDTNFNLFVQVVLILRWAHRNDEVVDEYKGFLQELCSAHNYYTKQVIDHLVCYFRFDNVEWENGVPNVESVRCFNNVHQVVKSILSIIPMSKEILIGSLKKNYPYFKKPAHEHETYVYNILQIIDYLPAMREELLKLLLSNLVTLDVHAPRSELESLLQQHDQNEQDEEIFDIEECEGEQQTESTPNLAVDHAIAHSLDLSLSQIFQFIRSYCFIDGTLNWEKTKSLYHELFKVFEAVILPTHAIYHVQFIMFYIVGFKPALALSFIQSLWKKTVDPNEAPIIRQASVIYIASILSRAMYISVPVVQEMLTEMSKWTHSYIARQEDNLCFDLRIHCVFYAACQSIFYIIAFRYKELVQGKGLILLQGLNLSKIVTCRLNPLKACVPVVVTHFASIARMYQLAYCYTIMEQNARCTLPQVRRDRSGNISLIQELQLETFFPFDPYLLIRSYEYIEPHYREYSGSVEQGAMDVEGDEDDDNEDDFLETTVNIQQGLNSSAFNYSTSPGFLQNYMH